MNKNRIKYEDPEVFDLFFIQKNFEKLKEILPKSNICDKTRWEITNIIEGRNLPYPEPKSLKYRNKKILAILPNDLVDLIYKLEQQPTPIPTLRGVALSAIESLETLGVRQKTSLTNYINSL